MGTWYSNRLFTVGDTIWFTKYWQNSYNTAAAGVYSGKYSFYATVSECIATGNNRVHNIKFTGLHNTVGTITGGGGYCTPSEVTWGYQNWITYNGNGGTVSSAHQTGYVGSSLTGTASRTGYTFAGWYSAASGGSKYTTIPDSDGYTFYAHWTANKYNVTLNMQGGSGGTASVSATYNAGMPSITKPTRTGYTFGGYYTGTNGTGTQYYTAAGASARTMTNAGAMTLYAKWTANTYSIHFEGNGALTGSMSNQQFTYDQKQKLTTNGFGRGAAYRFAGWDENPNIDPRTTTPKYTDSQEISNLRSENGANVTLYAIWRLYYIAPEVTSEIIATRTAWSEESHSYVLDDQGTCFHIEFDWRVDQIVPTEVGATNYIQSIALKFKEKSASTFDLLHLETFDTNMTSGSFKYDDPMNRADTENTYDILIELTDTYGETVEIYGPQTVLSAFISQAFFTMDFAAGGKGIGIGCPAPRSGLKIDMDMAVGSLSFTQYIGNIVYPVGSYYMSEDSTDPTTIFGGSWTQIKDRFILAKGDTYTAETGGNASVSYTPTGSNTGTAITVNQMPGHVHQIVKWNKGTTTVAATAGWYATNFSSGSSWQGITGYDSSRLYDAGTSSTGGGQAHTHTFNGTAATIATMPPYRTAYIWKRTALAE